MKNIGPYTLLSNALVAGVMLVSLVTFPKNTKADSSYPVFPHDPSQTCYTGSHEKILRVCPNIKKGDLVVTRVPWLYCDFTKPIHHEVLHSDAVRHPSRIYCLYRGEPRLQLDKN